MGVICCSSAHAKCRLSVSPEPSTLRVVIEKRTLCNCTTQIAPPLCIVGGAFYAFTAGRMPAVVTVTSVDSFVVETFKRPTGVEVKL